MSPQEKASGFDELLAANDRCSHLDLVLNVRNSTVADCARECLQALDAGEPAAEATKFLRRALARADEAEAELKAARQARDLASQAIQGAR